jgi:hypothetical protein
VASVNSMCPGSTQPLKNEYQATAGGKAGRCLRLTTYHQSADVTESGSLNLTEPSGPHGLVMGMLYFFYLHGRLGGTCSFSLVETKV